MSKEVASYIKICPSRQTEMSLERPIKRYMLRLDEKMDSKCIYKALDTSSHESKIKNYLYKVEPKHKYEKLQSLMLSSRQSSYESIYMIDTYFIFPEYRKENRHICRHTHIFVLGSLLQNMELNIESIWLEREDISHLYRRRKIDEFGKLLENFHFTRHSIHSFKGENDKNIIEINTIDFMAYNILHRTDDQSTLFQRFAIDVEKMFINLTNTTRKEIAKQCKLYRKNCLKTREDLSRWNEISGRNAIICMSVYSNLLMHSLLALHK